MKKISKICEFLNASYHYPMALFNKDGEIIGSFFSCKGFSKAYTSILDSETGNDYPKLAFRKEGIYGLLYLREQKQYLITGPFLEKSIDESLINAVQRDYHLEIEEREQVGLFLSLIPKRSLNSFLNEIALFEYLFNSSEIDSINFFKTGDLTWNQKLGKLQTENSFKEESSIHGTYQFERQLLEYVSQGDINGIRSFLSKVAKSQKFNEGKLAEDRLRQSKNLFIGFVSMIGKDGAIKGGLNIEETYNLIDLYTQECEKCSTISQVNQLRYTALIDFTKRVNESKHPNPYSKEVEQAIQYIQNNILQPISAVDVTNQSKISRSALMAQFKKETGETINHFIAKAKLKEAASMLRYTDKSLATISNQLCFSSQSYFQNLFKKEYEMTPLKYRNTHQL